MFEKISNAAEKLATNVSESRRGFLGRMGQAALGVAGVVGGLLALSTEAQAIGSYTHACQQTDSPFRLTGWCIDNRSGHCKTCFNTAQCPYGATQRLSSVYICGYRVSPYTTCTCP
jgi:hypothetical protein